MPHTLPPVPVDILLVDDRPANLLALEAVLADLGETLIRAASGEEALRVLSDRDVAVVLLDVRMPGLSGFETAKQIRAADRTRHTPVIFLSASESDEFPVAEAYRLGAVDYLLKPLVPDVLRAKVAVFVDLYRKGERVRQLEQRGRARAEAALRETERLYASLVNSLDGIVWEADAETFRFTFVSPQAEKILGYPPARWVEEPDFWRAHTHPDDVDRCAAFCRDATAAGRDHAFEYRMLAADGRVVWLHDVVTVRATDGGARRLRGIMLDVTARTLAEEERRREQDFLQAVLDNVGEAVIACDAVGRVTLVNWVARESTGVREVPLGHAEWVRRCPLFRPDRTTPVPAAERPLARAVRGERFRGVELAARTPDGRWLCLVAAGQPLRDAGGRELGAVVALRDATEERRLAEQVLQAQKMEAVGQLAGGVAHDFNNLLTVINGYADVLLGQVPAVDPARDMLGEMARAGGRAAELTRQLLAFGRKQILAPRVLDLNGVVAGVGAMLGRLIGEDVVLATRLQPVLGRVRADPGQVEQVIVNLCVNARDAMPLGGRLVVETRNVEFGAEHPAAHPDVRPGRYVMLAVADTGRGIPADVLPHVFEPFFTTKGVGEGTGLGLATVYGIVTQSGGHVEVFSEVGVGTTFKVYLPRVDAPAEAGPAGPESPAPRGAETLLVVEDDPAVRALTCLVLRAAGYAVLESESGQEAVGLAAAHPGRVDLLVTDVVMPGLGGRELAGRLSERSPGLKVLYLSGYTEDAVVRHGVREEQVDFLQKPFSPATLARKVREILDRDADGA
jgi:two-component system, cell cycle sensor histidine kinase and response regulator CckA